MSVAFVKEESAEAASETILPPRPISGRPNLVTETGLQMLKDELDRSQRELEAASLVEDVNERRRQSAVPYRDARYFVERVRTAHLMPVPETDDVVSFGHAVTYEREDGRKQTYRIVGEDEADPAKGTISYASPVAATLIGKRVGDLVQVGALELQVISISRRSTP